MELVNKMVELQEERQSTITREITGDITVSFDGKEIGKFQSISMEQPTRNENVYSRRFPPMVARGSGKTNYHMDIIEGMLRDEMYRQAVILDDYGTLEFIGGDDTGADRDGSPVFNDPIEQA